MNNKVLYVDDEATNRTLFQALFKRHFDILTAADGPQGLEILEKENEVDLVFTDFKMPGMNGLEFIQEAKKKNPDINYNIISGYFITPELEKAKDQGIYSNYFLKPFNKKEILGALDI